MICSYILIIYLLWKKLSSFSKFESILAFFSCSISRSRSLLSSGFSQMNATLLWSKLSALDWVCYSDAYIFSERFFFAICLPFFSGTWTLSSQKISLFWGIFDSIFFSYNEIFKTSIHCEMFTLLKWTPIILTSRPIILYLFLELGESVSKFNAKAELLVRLCSLGKIFSTLRVLSTSSIAVLSKDSCWWLFCFLDNETKFLFEFSTAFLIGSKNFGVS